MSKVELNVNAAGMGKILIDGKDMSCLVTGMEISVEVGQTTKMTLHCIIPELTAKLQGDVEWEVGDQGPTMERAISL